MKQPETHTLKLVVAYNGARFKGWQKGNGRTVQSTLEEGLARSLPSASHGTLRKSPVVRVDGSGRTDAGVHAEGQVASVIVPASVDPCRLLRVLNDALPTDLAVVSVETAPDRFHARYLASARTYRYRILDGSVGNPFLGGLAWRVPTVLEVPRMEKAADILIGTHDFAAFTIDREKSNTTRSLHSIRFERPDLFGSRPLEIFLRGDAFLWRQVRIMVAAIVSVGKGEYDATQLERILTTHDRSLASPAAPAWGLTLMSVEHRPPSPPRGIAPSR